LEKVPEEKPQGSAKLVSEKKTEINQYLETWKSDIEKGKLCVFMLDECHLLWGDLCGYIWGKSDRE
jgi:putative transposase